MTSAARFALLGAHEAPHRAGRAPADLLGPGERGLDAVDLVVELDDGTWVLLGVRTGSYVDDHADRSEVWDGGYVPLPMSLDLAAVRHFDFKQVFWIGPESHPCLVWSNAEALGRRAVEHLLTDRPGSRLLDGPDGSGLPRPEDLGVDVPASVAWHRLDPPQGRGSDGPDGVGR